MQFLAVYVREAHPTDGWSTPSNAKAGIRIKQPTTKQERIEVARHCCSALEITMPVVVDEMDDRVGHAYSGMPDRLYVLDAAGKVVYKGGRGPFGFKPREMEQSLAMLLLDKTNKPASSTGAIKEKPGKEAPARVSLLDNAEAWKVLPEADEGAGQPLPPWARALARPLPATTARMLELDYVQRAKSPLGPALRGKMRWVAARANRCAYGEVCALADLRRAGVGEGEVRTLTGPRSGWPQDERDALVFADKLTRAAYTVTDEEVARLIERYGEKKVMAMVALLAYANFQDRLVQTLGLSVEAGDPLPPLKVRFDREALKQAKAPPREVPDALPESLIPFEKDAEWAAFNFDHLQKSLAEQRQRPPRIRVPSSEEVKKGLPADYRRRPGPIRIRWTRVCMGYQPELSGAWLNTMRTFGRESDQARVFEELLFWVVTRSLQCFY